jgi:hypothetical protein
MTELAPFESMLAQIVPDWKGAALVQSVAGSGIGYQGEIALVVAPDRLVVVTPTATAIPPIYFDTILRVREVEFRGLILVRDGALVAPNEAAGLEIAYNAHGKFERTLRFLTYSANNARTLIEELSHAVEIYLDQRERKDIIFRPKQ